MWCLCFIVRCWVVSWLLYVCARLKFVLCLVFRVMFYGLLLFRVFVVECFCLINVRVSSVIYCVVLYGLLFVLLCVCVHVLKCLCF